MIDLNNIIKEDNVLEEDKMDITVNDKDNITEHDKEIPRISLLPIKNCWIQIK